ncbi:MAG: M20 metallopeptidase family protein [Mycobacterium leprae]
MSTLNLAELARDLEPRLIALRRELHQHPEVAWEERWTTEHLTRVLIEAGVTVLPLPLTTGLVAEVQGAGEGPMVAVRTDIDALPVQEETGLDYASTIPGKMHACGHDFHMAVVAGAALLLQQTRNQWNGTVRFLFQPAEETSGGANSMISAGALKGVQAIFGLHNKPDVPAGHVGLKVGPLMAAVDTITIHVTGKGGHAAIPDATVDPVVAGSAIVMALQTAVSRNISPLDSAVVSIGSFQAGSAHNVIPPTATLLGTVRTFNPDVRRRMPVLLERIIENVAAGYGATASLERLQGTPAVINDAAMVEVMRAAAERVGMTVDEAVPTMGGEDFAAYQERIPGCFIWVGTGQP